MIFVSTIIGVLGGILALSSLFVSKSPHAKQHLEKLAKYQGWIGLTMFGWGVWELIETVLNMGMIGTRPLLWGFWLTMAVADLSVGLLLGFGMISTYAFRGNEMAIDKGARLRAGLVKFQVPLGLLAIVTSLGYTAFWYV